MYTKLCIQTPRVCWFIPMVQSDITLVFGSAYCFASVISLSGDTPEISDAFSTV
ncbi:Uncharacterised protein [Vibrio cholerae]|nr:Uncharacterised protein [Vibrio cholerae]